MGATNKLPARILSTATAPGAYHDGGGLYLRVFKGGGRSWVFRFTWLGQKKDMGLGSAETLDLKGARLKAEEAREHVAHGRNPIVERDAALEALKAAEEAEDPPTFGEVATDLVDGLEEGFKNAKHRQQWRNTLKTYCAPIWDKLPAEVTTEDVLAILRPIWSTKQETASRVRGRIERVLDAAKARKLRTGENVAAWRGHLALFLPKPKKRAAKGHHESMPFAELPAFMIELRARPAVAARCLEWTILTAARSGEAFGTRRGEIDFERKVWTVPAERMKAGVEHEVPLSDAAIELLKRMGVHKINDPRRIVFAGRQGRQLSIMAMEMCLRRMGYGDIIKFKADGTRVVTRATRPGYTVHGFRSSFRDWVGECTDYPDRLAEMALAHQLEDAVEAAYRRRRALEKRRPMMQDWADWCGGLTAVEGMRAAG